GATPHTLAILRTSLEAGEQDGGFSESGRALASGAVAVCNDIEHDRRAVALGLGYRATASLPLHLGHQVVGTFNLYAGEAGYFDGAELALLNQVAADISFGLEAHRREERRKEAEVALRASEVRFRELAETIDEVFWIADPNSNRVLYVSPAFETIWGRSCRSLYTAPQLWSEAIHPEDRERVLGAVLRGRVSGHFDEEYRIVRPDGAVRWIRDQAFPVRTADGRVERIVGMARDITDRKAAEEQLRQAQKMESVGRLAAGIAHDFNNLLTVINGVAELALAEVPEGAPLREDLAIIRDAGARAAGLTGQLLAFSRRQVLRPEVMNLNTLVGEAENLLRRVLGEDIQVVTRLDPDLAVVSVDPGQFHQVVMNLAVNSRDAMPTGGVLTVETRNVRIEEARAAHSGVPPGRYVELSFSDTGAGMDPATKQRLFDPFFTTKEPGKGTGLGLATVHGIVKQTGGEIQVRSEVGKGTTFTIYLPIADQGAEQKARARPLSPSGGVECLVVVDDDDQVRALTTRLLQRAGYMVLTAADGQSALRLLDEFEGPVHLLLTDVVMPGMSGRQLADQVRQLRPQMRVLLMSGYTDAAKLRHGVLENGVELISKPYSSSDLLGKVRQVLES
ncbi:MAG TPA: ATP-binding protein, partial [Gemmatimonadales bacterium]